MRGETLYSVQALRCIAALGVVIGHAADLLIPHDPQHAWFWSVPWTGGVDLFFVISGFIMLYLTQDMFGRAGAARDFLARRIVRIVPSYWFFTTLTIVVVMLAGGRLKGTTIHWPQILASYGFLPWPRDDGKMVPIVAQGWTLNYEMLFYLLFALALPWRRGRILLGVLLSGLVLAHGAIPAEWAILRFWTHPLLLEFLGGIGIARLYLTGLRLPPVASIVGVGLGIAAYAFGDRLGLDAIGRAGTLSVPALLVAASVILTEQPRHVGRWWRAVRLGGDASYALYLAHYMIINAVVLGWVRFGLPWLGVVVATTISVVASILFHVIIERRVTRGLHRLLDGTRQKSV